MWGGGSGRTGILPDVIPALLSPCPPPRNFPNSSEWVPAPPRHSCLVVRGPLSTMSRCVKRMNLHQRSLILLFGGVLVFLAIHFGSGFPSPALDNLPPPDLMQPRFVCSRCQEVCVFHSMGSCDSNSKLNYFSKEQVRGSNQSPLA